MNIDLINGGFELCSGLLQVINIIKLVKDKEVKGVSLYPFILFTLWGLWNLYYYPSLGQTLSFIGGIFIVVTNVIWLGLAIYYKQFKIKKTMTPEELARIKLECLKIATSVPYSTTQELVNKAESLFQFIIK